MDAADVPGLLRARYQGWSWSLVQRHPGEVAVWRLERPDGRARELRYVKVGVASRFPRLLDEGARMRWAHPYLPVPEVLDCASDGQVDWLVTAGLPGRPASDEQLQADPERLVVLLAQGLRRLHAAPVERCPFDFTVDSAIALARARVRAGLVDPARDFHPEHAHLGPHGALAALRRLRPAVGSDDLVVCHGDYCLPNVLVSGTGGGMVVSGFVDVGELGVADRWWDLAVATWSLDWNLGPGWEELFLRAYRVDRDNDRVAFYRLLYDVVS
jgi:kanamycin kinase